MENRPQEQPKSADIVIMDYIRFLPEEKRKDYEVMLRRCNFHDSDDPLFPIMLFLLFFQESVSYNVDRIDDSISEMKSVLQKCGQDKFTRYGTWITKFVLIALTIVNLLMFGLVLSSPAGKIVKATVRTAQNELQTIHNYWTQKLEEESLPLQSRSFGGGWTFAVFAAILASAWIPSILVLLHLKRINIPKKREIQTGQKPNLFWRNPARRKKNKSKQKKRNKQSPAQKQEANTEQNVPEKEQGPAPKQEANTEQKEPEKEQGPAPKQEANTEQKVPAKEQGSAPKQEANTEQKEPEKEQGSSPKQEANTEQKVPAKGQGPAPKQEANTEQNKVPEKEQGPAPKQEANTEQNVDPGEKKNRQQTDNPSAEPSKNTSSNEK